MKGGLKLNVAFLPLTMRLIEISRSRFKQYKNSMLIPLCSVLGSFVDFWVYLRGDSFSKRIGKIR